jgi:hypothetical protein
MPVDTSSPITCAATVVSASHRVGLTLLGMIDEPGSFAGMISFAKPARGPHDISRISLTILKSETASVRIVPERWISALCAHPAP